MKTKNWAIIAFFILCTCWAKAQTDIMDLINEYAEEEPDEVAYTFKSTRIINAHSIERMQAHQLDFRINHRFGELNSGAYELWGLDQALISFDFGYGITDWLMVGFRRSTYEKTYDGSLKWSILRQKKGATPMPIAMSYYTNMGVVSLKDESLDSSFAHRLTFTHQLMVARKFNEQVSLQIMPTYVHRNLVDFDEPNDIFAVGIGGRYKFHRRVAFMFEYFYCSHVAESRRDDTKTDYYHPLSIGFDIETGGHVFQLFVSNSRIMEEAGFLSETTGDITKGGIYFGFNISRVFAIGKHEED